MNLLLIGLAVIASVCADAPTSEYLPPTEEYSGASSNVIESNFLESEPAHSLADDGYRYRTVKRFRLRHRRDVSELTNSYLPPFSGAASAAAPVYSAPAPVYSASAPEVAYAAPSEPASSYSAPQSFETTYETAASEPAHTLSSDGYRYKTVKRYRLRHRRDVSELTNSYLPPFSGAATADIPVYSAPAPEAVYDAPESTYETAASEPAHSLSADGYRYKAVKRYRYRHRH